MRYSVGGKRDKYSRYVWSLGERKQLKSTDRYYRSILRKIKPNKWKVKR